jgi:hypothetical protein
VIGGSEHDIWEMDGEVWKVTRPDRFGWTVLPGEEGVPQIAEATPLEYLERWLNANRLLGDNAKLRGVSETDEGANRQGKAHPRPRPRHRAAPDPRRAG